MSFNAVDYWNRDAPVWKKGSHPLMQGFLLRDRIIQALAPYMPQIYRANAILDSGAGSSGIHAYVDGINPNAVTAIDTAEHMLRLNPSGRKRLASADNPFQFRDGEFDISVQLFVNRYLHNDTQNAQELVRVTRKDGLILLMDYAYLGHDCEVREFNPKRIQRTLDAICQRTSVVTVAESSGVSYNPEIQIPPGPIYLVVGVK